VSPAKQTQFRKAKPKNARHAFTLEGEARAQKVTKDWAILVDRRQDHETRPRSGKLGLSRAVALVTNLQQEEREKEIKGREEIWT